MRVANSKLWDVLAVVLVLLAAWGALKVFVLVTDTLVGPIEALLVAVPVILAVYWGLHRFVLDRWRRNSVVPAQP